MRYRITVRGHQAELRGYIDSEDGAELVAFSQVMKPFGIVVASPADADYNPFAHRYVTDERPDRYEQTGE
jgi:hypothetical protein